MGRAGARGGFPGLRPQQRRELVERPRVDDARSFDPTTSRLIHAPSHERQLLGRVGVGVDRERRPELLRATGGDVVQIEALRLSVDLQHHALARGDAAHLIQIELRAASPVDQTPGGMREDLRVRIAQRANDALGLSLA